MTTAAVGLAVLLLGGNLFVQGAVSVAQALEMSDRLIGLTIVAVGTSLPELVASVIAARRGHSDLAVGNVVDSNIFNIVLCLGTAGLAGKVGAPLRTLGVDLMALMLMTLVGAAFIRSERGGRAALLSRSTPCLLRIPWREGEQREPPRGEALPVGQATGGACNGASTGRSAASFWRGARLRE